ncbi:glycosyltransferase family 4 protein [Lagierella sp.]|uniref:glycosyltransferase family 4 protein n=1 Tax=Lagierella sp. TaxID=2849657 RepID=UPI0026112E04|nr:glycosyltransferase family 4 protein [Lagierella sp.]
MTSKIKNIWIINHYADPPNIGKFNRHYNFAKNLIERGYSVKIFTASTIHTTQINMISNENPYKEKVFNGVDYVFLKASSYDDNGFKRVINILQYFFKALFIPNKFGKPDLVIASGPHPLAWIAGYFQAKKHQAKFITETRDLWPETFVAMGKMGRNNVIAKILYGIEKWMYKKSDIILFTLPGGIDYIKRIGLDTSKVAYINNGIVLEDYYHNRDHFVYEDEDLSNKDNFNVVFSGAIGKANDLGRVIRAFKIIQDRGYTDIKFLIFGDKGERKELEQYVRDEKIDNVIFKGWVNKQEVPSILSQSDLQVLSLAHLPELFKYGLSPNKLFEYLGSGKPVISNVECGHDLLEKYNCGLTVKGDSEEAMAEGIIYFYNLYREKPESYLQYCENSLKASKDFDFKNLTEKLVKVIGRLEEE